MQVFKVTQGVKREKYQTGEGVRGERDMSYWDGSDQCWIWHRRRKLAVWACETEGERADTHSWDQSNRSPYQIQTRHKLSIILFGWCPQLHIGHYYCSCFWKNKGKWLHSTENTNIYTYKDQRIECGLFPHVSYSTGSWQGRIQKKHFHQKKNKNKTKLNYSWKHERCEWMNIIRIFVSPNHLCNQPSVKCGGGMQQVQAFHFFCAVSCYSTVWLIHSVLFFKT